MTFLLSDIEGSTRLWEHHRDDVVRVSVRRCSEIISAAIAAHGGVQPLEQGEGDNAVGAFERASDALAAAIEAQRGLAAEPWPTPTPVQARMALHTGEAQIDGPRYVGVVLNRCARLRELACGGQILVSGATRELVMDHTPADVELRDLGLVRLRDLDRREHVYLVRHPELGADHPVPARLGERRHNLPEQLTSFVGRRDELEALKELIVGERLVTLTGAGGVGKTRLAIELARTVVDRHPDGVWWVDLAPLGDPGLLARAVGHALSVRERAAEPFPETLARTLAPKRALVLLDNCEHLIDAASELTDRLLRGCPHLVIVATSREPLGVEGETAWRVPSLSVPSGPEAVESDAVQLFVDRAVRARPSFHPTEDEMGAVVQICRRLDGIPLAIELAAARARVLSVDQIAAGLDDRFRLLVGATRTATPRQRTLEASVDWSHELLDERQQIVLRRLAAFTGSFDLEAAEAVCADGELPSHQVFDVLVQLIDRSLVQLEDSGARYRMLETIRQYGRAKLLAAGESDAVRARHLDHYTRLLERAAPSIEAGGTEVWVPRAQEELDNVRAALEWSVGAGLAAGGLRLALAWPEGWFVLGCATEGRHHIESLLAAAEPEPALLARGLVALAGIAAHQATDHVGATEQAQRALELSRQLRDPRLEARSLTWLALLRSHVEPAAAEVAIERAVAACEAASDGWAARFARGLTGGVRFQLGDYEGARATLVEVARDSTEAGDLLNLREALFYLGNCSMMEGLANEAESELREALALAEAVGDRYYPAAASGSLGFVATLRGDYEAARTYIEEQRRWAAESGNLLFSGFAELMLARLDGLTGASERGLHHALAGVDAFEEGGIVVGVSSCYSIATMCALLLGDLDRAEELARRAEAHALSKQDLGAALLMAAALARLRGDLVRAEDLARRSLGHMGPRWMMTAEAIEVLGGTLVEQERWEEAARLLGASDALRSRTGVVRWPQAAAFHEAAVQATRDALGPSFEDAWTSGSSLGAEEAVAYATRGRGARQRATTGWESLTTTEIEVARLVAEGLTNREIGERLFISTGTAKTHLAHIFTKLGLASRTELATVVVTRGQDASESATVPPSPLRSGPTASAKPRSRP